jgi:ABC-type sugar transport system permease subunit
LRRGHPRGTLWGERPLGAPPTGRRRGSRGVNGHLARTGWFFTAPSTIFFLFFWLLPVALALGYSFTNWRLTPNFDFVGFENYRRLFSDPRFLNAIRTTAVLGVMVAGVGTALSLGLALLLNDVRPRLGNLLRVVYFVPVVTDWVATGLVWQFVFLPFRGVFAGVVVALGLPQFAGLRWTSSADLALVAVAIFAIWKLSGLYVIIFSAGLRGIPSMYLEAARVDGAHALQVFLHVTLPLLRPITLFVLLIGFVTAIGLFEPIYMLTQGGPVDATRTLPLLMYENFFSYGRAGYASAMAVVTLLLTLVVALLAAGRLQYGFYDE